ncbi:DUF4277 domain-containing protein [Stieleria varia]|uniref:DUF4277 domain-containing protein n=1 Tax=Stieleria varia TaxID=2528005 RepID=A0A5C6B1S0_9BACT|nr:DUF4277 domain-containing protein [Stieleria varia]TWU05848.1 hypothetical protein Pla52n_15630 [Stieleria varia]
MRHKKRQPHRASDPAKLATKAVADDLTLQSRTIGALPIINRFIDRLNLHSLLNQFLPWEDGRSKVATSTAILLLVKNILLSREPIYGLAQWAAAYQPELLGL